MHIIATPRPLSSCVHPVHFAAEDFADVEIHTTLTSPFDSRVTQIAIVNRIRDFQVRETGDDSVIVGLYIGFGRLE